MTQAASAPREPVEEILFDARGFQRRPRGPSRHGEPDIALLAAMRHCAWPHDRPRVVGLVDHRFDPLREAHRLLFDEVTGNRHRIGQRPRWFVASDPMSQDPVWASAILLDPGMFKVALLRDWTSITRLPSLGRQADHLVALAWLGRYDLLVAGSQGVKAELERSGAVDASKILVARAAVRSDQRARAGGAAATFAQRRHIAVVVDESGDPDLGSVVAAHARSSVRARLGLVMVGPCPPEMRGALRTAYGREGGNQDVMSFVEAPSESDLDRLIGSAALAVVPSGEGTSALPVALASAALGTPAAMGQDGTGAGENSALVYPRGDADALARLFDAVAGDGARWEEARAAGRGESTLAQSEDGARELVDAVAERVQARPPAPAVSRGARTRLALLIPPPSGCPGLDGRSTAMIAALSRAVEVQVFSDAAEAGPGGPADPPAPLRSVDVSPRRFDASLSMLGNAGRYAGILEHLLARGGAALTEDARLVGCYAAAFGLDRTLALARSECDGMVSAEQIAGWMRDPHDMPVLFLSEVARAAEPLLVTSARAQSEVARLYGIHPRRLPVLQHRQVDPALLGPEPRQRLRDTLGWPRDALMLCASDLGFSAAAVVVWALRLLRDWRIDARLVLRGCVGEADRTAIGELARDLGLVDAVIFDPRSPSDLRAADPMIAADMAVQLGTHALSGPSDAVLTCIAAACPTIANAYVAETVDAPAFVRRVPDALSPVLVAEAALDILASKQNRMRPVDEARAFAAAHSPDLHARAVTEALGLDGGAG